MPRPSVLLWIDYVQRPIVQNIPFTGLFLQEVPWRYHFESGSQYSGASGWYWIHYPDSVEIGQEAVGQKHFMQSQHHRWPRQ